MKRRKGRCACGARFRPRSVNHRSCASCSTAHRVGRRCGVDKCTTCARAFARLDAYNNGREERGAKTECPCGCGATYASMRSGFSFTDARRDFITDAPNAKTGARRHGRRNGVLGKLREWKRLAWRTMVDEHLTAKGH